RRLAAVPAADQAGLRFVLHPAVTLLSSPYPLAAIWRVNQPDFAGDQRIDWDTGGDRLCVRRDGHAVTFDVLAEPALRFLSALSCEAPFEAAADAALAVDADFDLQGFLLASVQSRVIADFR
ncbi:MAG: DUF2063 domain-containing protein, partial [Betaproteobacteria bacterium]|nr:DUF2063 domain-containing protein [Betaproteobacteria bacterium]